MTLLIKTVRDLRDKLRYVLRHSLDDLDCSEDGLLADIGRVVTDALYGMLFTLSTS